MDVLARAFRDNPLNKAVVPGSPERRRRSNEHGMRILIGTACSDADLAWVRAARRKSADRLDAVLVAAPPGRYPLPHASAWAQLRCLIGQGWGTVQRWGTVYHALEAIHPVEPHWYLSLLGVAPETQGTGLGAALLRNFADRVDSDRLPAYLESDRVENVAFYQRAGFEVIRETRVLGVDVFCMWRAPT